MKAMFCFMTAMLVGMQLSCTANQTTSRANAGLSRELATPEVAVMPMRGTVLIAWKPVKDADGYFIYRETLNPPAKSLLGIGPKEAQGFVDHDPPAVEAQYSVQAFKVSDLSEKMKTSGVPSANPIDPQWNQTGRAMTVSQRM